jgi:hypothetical protein
MFENLTPKEKDKKAKSVTKALSNYPKNKSHDRHFDLEECENLGLAIRRLESDPTLQDLVLTVHHCYMNLMMNSGAYKIIENQNGVALVKNIQLPGAGAPLPKQVTEQATQT